MTHENCGFSHVIPGTGPRPARFMFIGEAGGEHEEYQEAPFVGRSGILLMKMIERFLGLKREQVFLSNVFQHHPPKNRQPKKAEIVECIDNVIQEYHEVKPDVVVLLGATALRTACGTSKKVSLHHGSFWRSEGSELLDDGQLTTVWYHPAAALRSPQNFESLAVGAKRFYEKLEDVDATIQTDYELVDEYEAIGRYAASAELGFDIETTTDTVNGKKVFPDIVGYSLSDQPFTGVYTDESPNFVVPILEDPARGKVCHNAKFEYMRLREHGIDLAGFEDTKGLAYLLGYRDTTLKGLTKELLGITPTYWDEAMGDVDATDPEAVRVQMAESYEYGAADSDNTLRLYKILRPEVHEAGMDRVYEIEMNVLPTLCRMEERGIKIDTVRVVKELAEMDREIDRLARAVYDEAGFEFRLHYYRDRSDALEKLGAPLKQKTEDNMYFRTGREILERIKPWNPELIDRILQHDKLVKLRQFLRSFQKFADSKHRLHPSYQQFGYLEETVSEAGGAPATGRLSASGPNVQQIPSRDRIWGKRVRAIFRPSKGRVWLKADFAQEEPRIAAVVAPDAQLQEDFTLNRDVYVSTADALYGESTTGHPDYKHRRNTGKTCFLGLLYGAGAAKIKQQEPSWPMQRVQQAIRRWSSKYEGLGSYEERMIEEVIDKGYVSTLFGRRRYISEVYMPDKSTQEAGYRQAVNTPIQGTAADVIKIMLYEVDRQIDPTRAALLTTVHDELDLEVDEDYLDEVCRIIKLAASDVLPGIPLPVEFEVGPSWGELKLYDA